MLNTSLQEELFLEFKNWLIGIFEDDPLAPEITVVYFFYGKINNMLYLRLLGTEIDKKEFSDFTYNPLESQYFYSKNLFKLFQNNSNLYGLKTFIQNSLKRVKNIMQLQEFNKKIIKIKLCNYYLG